MFSGTGNHLGENCRQGSVWGVARARPSFTGEGAKDLITCDLTSALTGGKNIELVVQIGQ